MEHKPAKSSNLQSIGYDADAKTMQVKFKGGAVYEADGVEPHMHNAFITANSPGAHFSQRLKKRFDWRKL